MYTRNAAIGAYGPGSTAILAACRADERPTDKLPGHLPPENTLSRLPPRWHGEHRAHIEYPLNVTEQLKGSLDYYLYTDRRLLVIEAKHADLARGFTQLAVELIALDQWCDATQPVLPGAVSTGDIWQFGLLQRDVRLVTQDVHLYRVPADVEQVLRILVAALAG